MEFNRFEFRVFLLLDPSLPYYLPIGGRIIGFIPFPRVLVLCEMQSVSFRIWTHVAVSISYDDNHYTTGTSVIWLEVFQTNINNLHTITQFQLFLSDNNNLPLIIWLHVFRVTVSSGVMLYSGIMREWLDRNTFFLQKHVYLSTSYLERSKILRQRERERERNRRLAEDCYIEPYLNPRCDSVFSD